MKYDNKSELKTVKKYHFKIVIPLIIAILIGMTGPLIANGLNLIMSQITPVYIMILTGTISILLFILAFYRAIISISRQKIRSEERRVGKECRNLCSPEKENRDHTIIE